jgi:hypothetical protein
MDILADLSITNLDESGEELVELCFDDGWDNGLANEIFQILNFFREKSAYYWIEWTLFEDSSPVSNEGCFGFLSLLHSRELA